MPMNPGWNPDKNILVKYYNLREKLLKRVQWTIKNIHSIK
jgi:hypothetical protein